MRSWALTLAIPLTLAGCFLDRSAGITDSSGGAPPGTGGGLGGDFTVGGGGQGGDGGQGAQGGQGGQGGEGGTVLPCPADAACVPTVPTDWAPVRATSTAYPAVDTPANCADGNAPVNYLDTPSQDPAVCEACTCGTVTGSACDWPHACFYNNSQGCNGGCDQVFLSNDNMCDLVANSIINGNASVRITTSSEVTDPGSCAPAGGAATVAPPWGNEHFACPVTEVTGACDEGQVCVGGVDAAYPATCVIRDGFHACPDGYPNQVDIYTGGPDSRGCTACACDAPTGVSCTGGSFTVFDSDCQGGTSISGSGSACFDVSSLFNDADGSVERTAGTPSGGSCAPTGGEASGFLNTGEAFTLCCQ